MGLDGLHLRLLKSCPYLAYSLFIIFTTSMSESTLSPMWKVSDVVSIFKKGSRLVPLNYRPIKLTSVCYKTLERIVADHINN